MGNAIGSPEDFFGEVMEIPIDGVLDLHTFHPRDVKPLVADYLEACHERGIFAVRIIHGKGKGVLRRTVHACLEKNPLVLRFGIADLDAGSWGATLVTLVPAQKNS